MKKEFTEKEIKWPISLVIEYKVKSDISHAAGVGGKEVSTL